MENMKNDIIGRLVVPKSLHKRTQFIVEFPVNMHPENILQIVEVLKKTLMKKINCMIGQSLENEAEGGPHGRG